MLPNHVFELVGERCVGGDTELVAVGLGNETVVDNRDHESVVRRGADESFEVRDALDISPTDLVARLVEVFVPHAARRLIAPHVGVDLDGESFMYLPRRTSIGSAGST